MLEGRDDYRYTAADDIRRIAVDIPPYPRRRQKLPLLGVDEAYLRESALERFDLAGIAISGLAREENLLEGVILRITEEAKRAGWLFRSINSLLFAGAWVEKGLDFCLSGGETVEVWRGSIDDLNKPYPQRARDVETEAFARLDDIERRYRETRADEGEALVKAVSAALRKRDDAVSEAETERDAARNRAEDDYDAGMVREMSRHEREMNDIAREFPEERQMESPDSRDRYIKRVWSEERRHDDEVTWLKGVRDSLVMAADSARSASVEEAEREHEKVAGDALRGYIAAIAQAEAERAEKRHAEEMDRARKIRAVCAEENYGPYLQIGDGGIAHGKAVDFSPFLTERARRWAEEVVVDRSVLSGYLSRRLLACENEMGRTVGVAPDEEVTMRAYADLERMKERSVVLRMFRAPHHYFGAPLDEQEVTDRKGSLVARRSRTDRQDVEFRSEDTVVVREPGTVSESDAGMDSLDFYFYHGTRTTMDTVTGICARLRQTTAEWRNMMDALPKGAFTAEEYRDMVASQGGTRTADFQYGLFSVGYELERVGVQAEDSLKRLDAIDDEAKERADAVQEEFLRGRKKVEGDCLDALAAADAVFEDALAAADARLAESRNSILLGRDAEIAARRRAANTEARLLIEEADTAAAKKVMEEFNGYLASVDAEAFGRIREAEAAREKSVEEAEEARRSAKEAARTARSEALEDLERGRDEDLAEIEEWREDEREEVYDAKEEERRRIEEAYVAETERAKAEGIAARELRDRGLEEAQDSLDKALEEAETEAEREAARREYDAEVERLMDGYARAMRDVEARVREAEEARWRARAQFEEIREGARVRWKLSAVPRGIEAIELPGGDTVGDWSYDEFVCLPTEMVIGYSPASATGFDFTEYYRELDG